MFNLYINYNSRESQDSGDNKSLLEISADIENKKLKIGNNEIKLDKCESISLEQNFSIKIRYDAVSFFYLIKDANKIVNADGVSSRPEIDKEKEFYTLNLVFETKKVIVS